MDNPQLVDYIRSQMAAGHTEVTIRDHLIQHGWPTHSVDAAFAHYNRSHVVSEPKPATKHAETTLSKAHPRRGGRDTKRRRPKLRTGIIILALLTLAVAVFLRHKQAEPEVPVVREPTMQQKQSLDVVTLGGAVGQYVSTNDKRLPTYVSPAPDGSNSVVLCGAICDPSTWQVSSLSAYKASGVKMVSYAEGLEAPDAATLLLVSGARCNPEGTQLSTKDVKPLSMSILYASQDGSVLKQRCVIL